jgi:HSP20 family protein
MKTEGIKMFGLTPYDNRKCQISVSKPRDIFDYFFGEDFLPAATGNFSANFNADIRDLGKEYVIEAEMPGLSKEDIKLGMNGDILTIEAEKKEEASEERGNYIRRERRYGTFTRSFRFEEIRKDNINAKFENGVLRVTLPKQESCVEQNKAIDIN